MLTLCPPLGYVHICINFSQKCNTTSKAQHFIQGNFILCTLVWKKKKTFYIVHLRKSICFTHCTEMFYKLQSCTKQRQESPLRKCITRAEVINSYIIQVTTWNNSYMCIMENLIIKPYINRKWQPLFPLLAFSQPSLTLVAFIHFL